MLRMVLVPLVDRRGRAPSALIDIWYDLEGTEQRDQHEPLTRLSEWATDITGLTWSDGALFETISHAIALDFPHCGRRN